MTKRQRGFTLIELSIVLVIIGLIVGGVLVGRDLILAAQVRKTGTLVEQINTATYAFKNKYNCLPGDCANVNSFFPYAGTICETGTLASPSAGTCPFGNGDGEIFSTNPSFGQVDGGLENAYFFQQLIAANLLTDTRYCIMHATACQVDYAMGAWGLTIPVPSSAAAYGGPAIGVVSVTHTPWAVGTPTPGANHALYFGSAVGADTIAVVSSSVLFTIDSKFDDGFPLSGRIQAVGVMNAGFYNGRGGNDGYFYGGVNQCNNTGVSPSVYFNHTDYDCPVLWMTSF